MTGRIGRIGKAIVRALGALVMVPMAAALALLALANRQPVTVSFDPFDPSDAASSVTLPLYVLGFTILLAGVVAGGFAAWLGQARHRRLGSRLAAENVRIQTQLASLQAASRGEARALPPGSQLAPTGPPSHQLPSHQLAGPQAQQARVRLPGA